MIIIEYLFKFTATCPVGCHVLRDLDASAFRLQHSDSVGDQAYGRWNIQWNLPAELEFVCKRMKKEAAYVGKHVGSKLPGKGYVDTLGPR